MAVFPMVKGVPSVASKDGLIIIPSSCYANTEYSSTYAKENAIKMNHTQKGWLPASGRMNDYFIEYFGAVKDVKYLLFAMTATNYGDTINYATPIVVDISVSTDGGSTFSHVSSNNFERQGTSFIYAIYPINKQANAIKVELTVASGSPLEVGAGYKIASFE